MLKRDYNLREMFSYILLTHHTLFYEYSNCEWKVLTVYFNEVILCFRDNVTVHTDRQTEYCSPLYACMLTVQLSGRICV